MLDFVCKSEFTPLELFNIVIENMDIINGITLLGGEPLDQDSVDLIQFLALIKNSGLSVVLFTGYTKSVVYLNKDYINNIDILISEPYIDELRTIDKYLIGSTNQEIAFLTDIYSNEDLLEDANYQEIFIDEDGQETFTGFSKTVNYLSKS